MKNVIGQISMYAGKDRGRSLRLYFHKHLYKIIGNSVVFDIDKLIVRKPEIDDNKIYDVGGSQISFTTNKDITSYLGKYDVIQKDETTFKLKKCKDG